MFKTYHLLVRLRLQRQQQHPQHQMQQLRQQLFERLRLDMN